ncbi:MAG: molecular chaperone HtpG, partial [Bradymonadia bacterium]
FGVGFYSAFLVADHVEVVSRRAGSEDAFRWTSDGKSGFSIAPAERDEVGTTITLHLQEEFKEQYTREWTLKNLVKQYSDFVSYPIHLEVSRPSKEEGEEDAVELEQINEAGALWKRAPEDVTEEQYTEFYQHVTSDFSAPLVHTHFSLEGSQEFTGLLFVPSRPPFDMFDQNAKHGVRLYVNRVFIMDDADELLPVWLRFVRGVVDSSDLPLNVSRDVLQDSRSARIIRKQIVKRVLETLENLAENDTEKFMTFWNAFGRVLKEGIHYDGASKDRLAKLARFHTTADGEWTTLEEYVERMPEGQKDIYYAVGESASKLSAGPHLEGLKAKGYEVLLMIDSIDQWVVDSLAVFDDKKLVSAMQADLSLDDSDDDSDGDDKDEKSAPDTSLGAFGDGISEVLGDRIQDARASTRLADSPVCLVFPQGGVPSHIERMLRQQQDGLPAVKRIFELNASHPLIGKVRERFEADGLDAVREDIELLYDQALLLEGAPLDDPATFAKRMTALMMR